MEVVKKTNKFTVFKKRNGRFAVKSSSGSAVNGDEKASLLAQEGLIKLPVAKKIEQATEESSAEE